MTTRITSTTSPVPSEHGDEVDNIALPDGRIWAYPCKLPSCPDFGKSWTVRSNFLVHLQEQEAYSATAPTPAARRAIEIQWRYMTDLNLLPRAPPAFRPRKESEEQMWTYSFKDSAGRVITRHETQREMDKGLHRVKERNLEVVKKYSEHGWLQQYRLAAPTNFRCDRCNLDKTSKLIATVDGNWDALLCNGCYEYLRSNMQ